MQLAVSCVQLHQPEGLDILSAAARCHINQEATTPAGPMAFQGSQGDEERRKEQLLPLSICRIAFFSKLN